jgi:hypothetical protein
MAQQALPALPQSPAMFRQRPYVSHGLIEPGNVDLYAQPSVPNPDGGMSTVNSFSVNFDGKEYLLPTVTPDGRLLSQEDAIREFEATGRHLGVFDSPDAADAYAKNLHEEYAAGKYRQRSVKEHAATFPPVRAY